MIDTHGRKPTGFEESNPATVDFKTVSGGGHRAEAMKRFPRPRMQSIPRQAVFLLGMYAGAALLTLGFQSYVRLEQCSGYTACTVSLAKGIVWSIAWPASWPVYAAGFKRAE
jgi:hypothetical protein